MNDITFSTEYNGALTSVSSLAINMSVPTNPTTDQNPCGFAACPAGPDRNLISLVDNIRTISNCFNINQNYK